MAQRMIQSQEQRLQMILAPQMRQSLEILQAPLLELRTLIQQEVEQNPTVEEQAVDNVQLELEQGSSEVEEAREIDFDEEFAVLARLDDEWKEYFQQNQAVVRTSRDEEEKRQFFLDSLSQSVSLQEHLIGQLHLFNLNEEQVKAGEQIIGNINDDGFLTASLEHLVEVTALSENDIQQLVTIIQGFDPVGVGARSLEECLLIQLDRLDKSESLAAVIVREHLNDLGAHRYQDISRALKVTADDVMEAARLVATLEPRPGRMFASDVASYVLPEVLVQKVNGKFSVIINDDDVPHLRISKHYRSLMEDPSTTDEVKAYIREKVKAGSFLIRSIGQRQQTIRRIAEEVLDVQEAFMDEGLSALKPLTMGQVADKLGIHETTVSRAIANKYMQTPQGLYEMKYFFTPGLQRSDGSVVSNETVKEAIRQLVEQEPPAKPLSDQALMDILNERGIKVARRTVAKYREELRILPSHLRKQR